VIERSLNYLNGVLMKLAMALNEKTMDVRLVDRLLAEGKVTKAQVDEYLSNLADEEGNYEVVDAKSSQASEEEITE
jgi:hypothetical protein